VFFKKGAPKRRPAGKKNPLSPWKGELKKKGPPKPLGEGTPEGAKKKKIFFATLSPKTPVRTLV